MASISETIRKAILSADASRYRIARGTGIEEAALSRFVNRKRGLSMEALDQLAEYFGFRLIKPKEK